MTREEIISGLQFTIDMFLMDPITGETLAEPRNDMSKTTIDACRGAIELLNQESTNSVLKNIKAEISDEITRMYMYRSYANGLGKAIKLIDKYMAESED